MNRIEQIHWILWARELSAWPEPFLPYRCRPNCRAPCWFQCWSQAGDAGWGHAFTPTVKGKAEEKLEKHPGFFKSQWREKRFTSIGVTIVSLLLGDAWGLQPKEVSVFALHTIANLILESGYFSSGFWLRVELWRIWETVCLINWGYVCFSFCWLMMFRSKNKQHYCWSYFWKVEKLS